jgi:muramoyltetrapeptide carboxypeptidase LdcA involved in peptidoglycan recycling
MRSASSSFLTSFLGYSDTTVSHLACFRAGLTSFYGPAFISGFAENCGMFPFMTASVRKTLFSSDPIGVIEPHREGWTVEHLDWSVPEHQASFSEEEGLTDLPIVTHMDFGHTDPMFVVPYGVNFLPGCGV